MEFLRREEVLAACRPYLKGGWFVYFLIRDGEIIYVGKSENPISRVSQHIHTHIRKFDSYHIIEVPEGEDVDDVERQYILNFRPVFNFMVEFPKSFVAIGETVEARIRYRIAAGQAPMGAARAEGLNPQSFYSTPFYRELVGKPPAPSRRKKALDDVGPLAL